MDGVVGAGKSRQQNFQLLVDDSSAVEGIEEQPGQVYQQ